MREHLGLFVTAVVFAMFTLRLLAVSYGSTTTALIVLQQSAPATVMAGLATTVGVPLALGWLVGRLIVLFEHAAGDDRDSRWVALAYLLACCLAIALIVSWFLGVLAVAYALFSSWLTRRRQPRAHSPALRSPLMYVPLLLTAVAVVVSDRMWLAPEKVTYNSGSADVGYMLDADEASLVVLRDKDRVVLRLPVANVATREYCTQAANSPWWLRPLYQVTRSQPRYPKCPAAP